VPRSISRSETYPHTFLTLTIDSSELSATDFFIRGEALSVPMNRMLVGSKEFLGGLVKNKFSCLVRNPNPGYQKFHP